MPTLALSVTPSSPLPVVKHGNRGMVGRVSMGASPYKPVWRKPVAQAGRPATQLRVFDNQGAIDFVAEALKRAEAKRIARDADCSHRSVEKWKGRLVAPQLHNFLNACQAIPELKAAMRQLLAMEGENDPTFQRALADLVRAAQRAKP